MAIPEGEMLLSNTLVFRLRVVLLNKFGRNCEGLGPSISTLQMPAQAERATVETISLPWAT